MFSKLSERNVEYDLLKFMNARIAETINLIKKVYTLNRP